MEEDFGSKPRKSLGQHWLYDRAALEAICEAAEVNEHDVVLEVGPGLGTLTSLLVDKAKQVVAVELDEKLAQGLPKKVEGENLQIVNEDVLKFDFSSLPAGYKLVANIPYYLTSNLIRLISEASKPPEVAVLLVQKEVARRVAAVPGEMSLLSVTAQYYWQVYLGREVARDLFTPPPKVDSQILILRHRPSPLFENTEPEQFFRLVRAGFSQRRKTLLNSLSSGLKLSRDQIEALCEQASLDSNRRAQTLSLQDWQQLYLSLHT